MWQIHFDSSQVCYKFVRCNYTHWLWVDVTCQSQNHTGQLIENSKHIYVASGRHSWQQKLQILGNTTWQILNMIHCDLRHRVSYSRQNNGMLRTSDGWRLCSFVLTPWPKDDIDCSELNSAFSPGMRFIVSASRWAAANRMTRKLSY